MTRERDFDPDPTLEIEGPLSDVDQELKDVDPEQTLAREDWESVVIRRIAPRVAAVQGEVGEAEQDDEARFGWESASLRRLSRELQRGERG